jgi:hypothetical protein
MLRNSLWHWSDAKRALAKCGVLCMEVIFVTSAHCIIQMAFEKRVQSTQHHEASGRVNLKGPFDLLKDNTAIIR